MASCKASKMKGIIAMFMPQRLLKLLKKRILDVFFVRKILLNKKLSESTGSKRLGQEFGDILLTKKSQCMTKLATGTFTGLIFMLSFAIYNIYNTQNVLAADGSISVTISGNPSATISPSAEGTFADSGDVTISVSSTAETGYTLAITGGGNTNLTGKTDSSKVIQSISSAMDRNTFDTTANNNKWGYKPSMHYNSSAGQRATNTDYLPSPGIGGDIIDVVNDSSSNNYTLSIAARVTNTLGFQSYENNSFTVSAIGNVDTLYVNYDGNGLTFGSTSTNLVEYESTGTRQETVTKYSHTPNISDAGVQSGNYANNANTNQVITVSGATSLHIRLTYGGESDSYDWASFWTGSHPDYTATSNYSTGVKCGGNTSGKYGGGSGTTVECDISGDTVTFAFRSDGSGVGNGYGYYAVITGTGTVFDRQVTAGSYATPTGSNILFNGWSTTQTTPGAGKPNEVEYKNESEVMSYLSGTNGETKTLYAVWQQKYSITFTKDSYVSSISVIDSGGSTVGTITSSGQTLMLTRGETYTLSPYYSTGYSSGSITKTSGEGTLNGSQFTVGAGTATLYTTSSRNSYSITVNFAGSGVSSVSFAASGYSTKTVSSSGSSVSLVYGVRYTVTMTTSSGYTFSSWAKASGSGTLSSTTSNPTYFTVGAGSATLTATGVQDKIYIQDFTESMCQAQASSSSVTVYDKRDDNSYTVRWINGNCWMTQNLRFTGTSINSSTTNINTTKTLVLYDLASSTNCTSSETTGASMTNLCYRDSGTTAKGVWYNYAAISAGTITGSSNSTEDVYNLCPANWTLPTSSQQVGIKGTDYISSFSPVMMGYYSGGNLYNTSLYTRYWSSTASDANPSDRRRILEYYHSTNMYADDPRSQERYIGNPARCVRKQTSIKYAHTSNVSDAGVASGEYANNLDTTDTVTISGANTLKVTIYYDAESTSYDWVSVYQSPFNISTSNDATVSTSTGNISGKLSGRNSGRTTNYSSWYSQTYTVSGDTVEFHFKSDSSQVYYGYYAIVEKNS